MNLYLATPTDTAKERLTTEVARLREASLTYPLPLTNALANLFSHAEVLLDRQKPMEELFRRATSNDISDLTDKLADNLQFELGRERRSGPSTTSAGYWGSSRSSGCSGSGSRFFLSAAVAEPGGSRGQERCGSGPARPGPGGPDRGAASPAARRDSRRPGDSDSARRCACAGRAASRRRGHPVAGRFRGEADSRRLRGRDAGREREPAGARGIDIRESGCGRFVRRGTFIFRASGIGAERGAQRATGVPRGLRRHQPRRIDGTHRGRHRSTAPDPEPDSGCASGQ